VVDASHFDQDAVVYDSGRPGWPSALIDDVISYGERRTGDTALEIGAGTGKLTEGLLERGIAVVALEPSAPMAAILRSRLGQHPLLTVHESTFEDWADSTRYPLVCAAAAWHWVPKARRVDLATASLRPGGTLALCWNYPAMPPQLRALIEEAYATHAPELVAREPNASRPLPDQTADAELRASGRFATVECRRHRWEEPFSSERYIDLLKQSVAHQRLPDRQREALFGAIRGVIDRRGGAFDFPHEADLVLARTPA
jgi:SAM-dependent methyltransferase